MSKIARVWSGKTKASDADEYAEYMKRTGVRDLRNTKGNLGVLMFKRVEDGTAEFWIISFWESVEAIKRFAGKDIAKAVYYPEDEKYLFKLEPELVHYEVLVDSLETEVR